MEWRDDYGSHGPVGDTWGELQLWLGDTLVWGGRDSQGLATGICWSWIDLLEFLANAWSYLLDEEQYPLSFNPSELPLHLGELASKAMQRWLALPEESADEEEDRLRDFLAVHDLSEGLHGISLPKLICLRHGEQMIAATIQQEYVFAFKDTMSTLECIGNAIMRRIAPLNDRRSQLARLRWTNRRQISASPDVAIAARV
ncbi:hypothetical protein HSX11_19050 [Oxalobacteraceae bacterium]|nr:hypothetical protein [Oxalobacteraceae bacterium]